MKSWAMLLAAGSLALVSQGAFAQARKAASAPKPVVIKTNSVKATAVRTPVTKPPGAPVVTNPRTPPSKN